MRPIAAATDEARLEAFGIRRAKAAKFGAGAAQELRQHDADQRREQGLRQIQRPQKIGSQPVGIKKK